MTIDESHTTQQPTNSSKLSVFVIGATGTAGQATVRALLESGHDVTCFLREKKRASNAQQSPAVSFPETVDIRYGDVTDLESLTKKGFGEARFDVLVSCLTSRTGVKHDAWAIDYQAHSTALQTAKARGVSQMILLSAICVQKPQLAFQHAKLAFEKELIDSGLNYSIVRPTAFFKSLSGQVERVKNGKPFLIFGDGQLTSCKPISDSDLGKYMARCITDTTLHRKILPIGGPGEAITPRQQGEWLFELTGQTPRFRHVPVAIFDTAIAVLGLLSRFSKRFEAKAELARIGRYYATESMLLLNPQTADYDASATPSTGTDTLKNFYKTLLDGTATVSRGEHSVFSKKNHNDN